MTGAMADTCNFHDLAALSEHRRAELLMRTEADLGPYLDKVRPIIEAVGTEGDAALARFARELDRADVPADRIAVTEAEFAAAFKDVDGEVIEALEFAIENIRTFHQEQLPAPLW